MISSRLATSAFSLAKGKELVGDDMYDLRTFGTLTIAIVCDGVGSAREGRSAAKRVVNHLITNFKNRPKSWSIATSVRKFVTTINAILFQESLAAYERPEYVTTLALVMIEGNRLYGANVGDSRIYLLRDGKLSQLSVDHVLTDPGYDNVLTQAIGIDRDVSFYYFENELAQGDRILLCSDGLTAVFDDAALCTQIPLGAHALVRNASRSVEDDLPDDTTAVVIDILAADPVEQLKRQDLRIPKELHLQDSVDGYTLTAPLASHGRIWLASRGGREEILKFPPAQAADDPAFLDLFVKEAWNAARLKAGFFPKAYLPEGRTCRYYVMEKLDGTDLRGLLEKRRLGIEDAVLLAKTLLRMGQYLVAYDLVHGDIKPDNIFVTERDGKHIFKIIDFGNITEIYSIGNRSGTPSYLAPERFHAAAISESTEIFAIGVTLYQALTGMYPYGEIEPFQQPVFGRPRPLNKINPNVPLWLDSVVLRAVASDAERRYQNYSEMLYDLEHTDRIVPFAYRDIPLIERIPPKLAQYGLIVLLIADLVIALKYFLS